MPEMADILRAVAPEYLAKYGERMLPSHKRAINDIILCRTQPLGGKVFRCNPCDEYRNSYHSCKNRSCPKCGNDDATHWLAVQTALLLPVQYFMVTSTLPKELRRVARSNQKLIYGLLLRTTAEAIQKLARDPKWVGGEIGLLGVPQTWKRDMGYHVHTHFIVPGGGVSTDSKHWLPAQRDYLMPERAVAKILRATFRDALKKLALSELSCLSRFLKKSGSAIGSSTSSLLERAGKPWNTWRATSFELQSATSASSASKTEKSPLPTKTQRENAIH